MEVLKKALAEALREEMKDTVNRVVSRAFVRLTENVAKVEAKTVQNARQLLEMRLMSKRCAWRPPLVPRSRRRPARHRHGRLPLGGPPQSFAVHTPRPSYS